MQTFFTADIHFGHRGVIDYAGRPFRDIDHMDASIIERWNATVGDKDEVYIVGDFALCSRVRALACRSQLAGRLYLVRGNHDKGMSTALESSFEWAKDYAVVKVGDPSHPEGRQRIVLCHYAMRVWDMSHRGTWMLYGHSHGNLADDPHALSLDVGMDCWDYAPVSYERLKERMAAKDRKPVDHHGAHNHAIKESA